MSKGIHRNDPLFPSHDDVDDSPTNDCESDYDASDFAPREATDAEYRGMEVDMVYGTRDIKS